MFLWDRLYWQTKREILADIVAQVIPTTNNNNTDKTETRKTKLILKTTIETNHINNKNINQSEYASDEKVDSEPVVPVSTNSDYEYEEDILPTYIKYDYSSFILSHILTKEESFFSFIKVSCNCCLVNHRQSCQIRIMSIGVIFITCATSDKP